jgi:AraC-like DNA-binding protein
MSESNFSQHFKKEMGLSPQKYLNNLKLEESLALLQHDTVTEVSFELGYDSPSHFIRIFKEKYKTTPKQYQLKGLPLK